MFWGFWSCPGYRHPVSPGVRIGAIRVRRERCRRSSEQLESRSIVSGLIGSTRKKERRFVLTLLSTWFFLRFDWPFLFRSPKRSSSDFWIPQYFKFSFPQQLWRATIFRMLRSRSDFSQQKRPKKNVLWGEQKMGHLEKQLGLQSEETTTSWN